MDLSTTYMGLKLSSPLVVSASPLSESVDNIRHMEDAGAAAVVLFSLFEEQLSHERLELFHHLTFGSESYAEATSYFPEVPEYTLGPEEYLKHITRAKRAVDIPIIASLNGFSLGGWTDFARRMQEAGADAVELNIYHIPTDPTVAAELVESGVIEILEAVKSQVAIPVAVKLSPYYTAMAHLAARLDRAGANGLVLFNRFYQPDIDLDRLEVTPNVLLSQPQALRLPLRWIAILYGRISASLAATSGIHDAPDVLKMLMAGADVTMMCATLIRNGIGHLTTVRNDLLRWMEDNEYASVEQMKGSMSQQHVHDPATFERAQYMRALQTIPVWQ
ncbi:MAG TPA: dihydroorotate dehydrogenase-like protein [candidate division Zixibacteria bacterium]|jgi:dihydroorotate dehydrogenase (fumarate)